MLHGGRATVTALLVATWMACAGDAFAGRPALKGPYLTGLSESGVVIRFELAAPAAATVQVTGDGPAVPPAVARVVESRAVASFHDVAVQGLEPGVTYRYSVRSGGAPVGDGRFVTAPKGGSDAPLTFLVYGDGRTDVAAHTSVVHAMEQVPADFVINTGDLVEAGGSAEDWQSFFDVNGTLLRSRPIFSAFGNHESVHDPSGATFLRYLGFRDASGTARPYGTVRLGNVRLFFLNAEHDWAAGDERSWLEQELGRSDAEAGVLWRFVVVHDGPWSAGPHGSSRRLVEGHVPDLLAAHKIDLLFSGHDHTYQRGDAGAIKYIVSGGAGSPLYAITRTLPTTRKALSAYHFVEVRTSGDEVRIVARRPDGAEIDRCGFRKGASWDCDTPRAAPADAVPSATPPAPSGVGSRPAPLPATTSRCGVGAPLAGGSPRGAGLAGLAVAGLLALSTVRRRPRRG